MPRYGCERGVVLRGCDGGATCPLRGRHVHESAPLTVRLRRARAPARSVGRRVHGGDEGVVVEWWIDARDDRSFGRVCDAVQALLKVVRRSGRQEQHTDDLVDVDSPCTRRTCTAHPLAETLTSCCGTRTMTAATSPRLSAVRGPREEEGVGAGALGAANGCGESAWPGGGGGGGGAPRVVGSRSRRSCRHPSCGLRSG